MSKNSWDELLSHLEDQPELPPGDILIDQCRNAEERLDEAIRANVETQYPYVFVANWPHRAGYQNTRTGQTIWLPFYVIGLALKDTAYFHHFSDYYRIRRFAEDYVSKGLIPKRQGNGADYLWREPNVSRER